MSEEPKPPTSWWQTIPGILTAISGTILALTGLIGALTGAWQQVGVFQNKTEPQVCNKLSGLSIHFDANNYHGVVGPAGIPLRRIGDRSFQFETNVVFSKETNREFSREINDKIVGSCQDKTIQFTRKLSDDSSQRYSGTISESPAGAINLEGTFLDENDKKYYWSGSVEKPIP